jgi:hypothetical protein
MRQRFTSTSGFTLVLLLVMVASPRVHAQEAPDPQTSSPERLGPIEKIREEEPRQERDGSIFPLGADEAIRRGYVLPLPFGVSVIGIDNVQRMVSSDLAIAVSKGAAPPAGTELTPIPFVTTDRLEGRTTSYQLKADMWLLPNVNLFATLGKVEGDIDIGVDIDFAQVLPPPICRLLDPCERELSFVGKVDNVTLTLGGLVAYGGKRWFAAAMAAKTFSVSSEERSNIESLNFGFRTGPRFGVGKSLMFTPYFGANYLDLENTVEGVVRAEGAFADGDDLALRFRTKMDNPAKWSAILGFNLEIGRRWDLQVEHDEGNGGNRTLASLAYRF